MAMEDGHIVLMTPFMQDRLRERNSSFQTDTIEGFLFDEHCPTANVTMTSGFCPLLNHNIPLVISLLMGKSATHYAAHFAVILRALEMPTDIAFWESDPDKSFPGTTCDFSDAKRCGFEKALRKHCTISSEEEADLDRFYRCCT
jgi:hypothetical protein